MLRIAAKLAGSRKNIAVRFSHKKIFSGNMFLFHKTTRRVLYDEERTKAVQEGVFDMLFTNGLGCRSILFAKIGSTANCDAVLATAEHEFRTRSGDAADGQAVGPVTARRR